MPPPLYNSALHHDFRAPIIPKWVQFEEATALLAEKDQQLLEENLQVKRLESQLAERDAEIETLQQKLAATKTAYKGYVTATRKAQGILWGDYGIEAIFNSYIEKEIEK